MKTDPKPLRICLRDPIPEIIDAARYLDAAVSAHTAGRRAVADELIRLADMPAITEWTESLWGAGGPWSRPLRVESPLRFVPKDQRIAARMPSKSEVAALLARDGFHCRFCGIPLVRAQTRQLIRTAYPEALRWGDRNAEQHAGLQALWLQYDHLIPHARGGTNELSNMVVTCAPCNNGRSNLTLEEVGLVDPRLREPVRSTWDGLERFRVVAGHASSAAVVQEVSQGVVVARKSTGLVVAGVDVGGSEKGFHAVAFKDGAYLGQATSPGGGR